MFLTCLLNSRPPALKRNSFGILFHCFAAKYLTEFNPYYVVFTFGSIMAKGAPFAMSFEFLLRLWRVFAGSHYILYNRQSPRSHFWHPK